MVVKTIIQLDYRGHKNIPERMNIVLSGTLNHPHQVASIVSKLWAQVDGIEIIGVVE